jgi:hypothetical protein
MQQSRLDRPKPIDARGDRSKSDAIPLVPTAVEEMC